MDTHMEAADNTSNKGNTPECTTTPTPSHGTGTGGSGAQCAPTEKRLVSCLKVSCEPLPRQARGGKHIRVRFVRSHRGPRVEEGADSGGPTGPHRPASAPVTTPSPSTARIFPRLLSASHVRSSSSSRRQEGGGGRHGGIAMETPTSMQVSTTSGATQRSAGLSRGPPSGSGSGRALWRVRVRGNVDSTVIGEVYRENFIHYSLEDLTLNIPSSRSSVVPSGSLYHVPMTNTDKGPGAVSMAITTTTTKACTVDVTNVLDVPSKAFGKPANKPLPRGGGETTNTIDQRGCVRKEIIDGQHQPAAKAFSLGARVDINPIFPSQDSQEPADALVAYPEAGLHHTEVMTSPRARSTLVKPPGAMLAGGSSCKYNVASGASLEETTARGLTTGGYSRSTPAHSSRLVAKMMLQRKPQPLSAVSDPPESVDLIDIGHSPVTSVESRVMTPARQVWASGQSASASSPNSAGATTGPVSPSPAPSPRAVRRRAVSVRILPRREQLGTPAAAGRNTRATTNTRAGSGGNTEVQKMSDIVNSPDAGDTLGSKVIASRAPAVRPSVAAETRTQTSSHRRKVVNTSPARRPVPAAPAGADLLSSCMGGLGEHSTRWLAEQARDRALRQLEPVTRFSSAPAPHPLTACFEYAGTALSHSTVLDAAEKALRRCQGAKVTKVQFVARSVILACVWLANRWAVTVSDEAALRALVVGGVSIFGKEVKCRNYDVVIAEEYKRFLEKEE